MNFNGVSNAREGSGNLENAFRGDRISFELIVVRILL